MNRTLNTLLIKLRELRQEEWEAIQNGFDSPDEKALNQLVTDVDIRFEKKLVAICTELLPESTFLTEEKTIAEEENVRYRWIIDPIDGTTNFIHQIPAFAISIALQDNGHTIMGVVYELSRDEMFYASQGQGAFLNGESISVARHKELKDTLLATGFPYYDFDQMAAYLNVLRTFMHKTRGLRRIGSAAVDLAYTACGRFDGFFEYGLSPWDVAAGAFIVQEAGGTVCDFSGEDDYIFGKEIIASQKHIFEEFKAIIAKEFKHN
jgi:myo-inositol-1(or 4)-monophosphatase